MLNSIREQSAKHGRPDVIPLSDYADEETFNFLLPKAGWTFDQWHAVNQHCADILRSHGYNVMLVKLELDAYYDFLTEHRLNNSPEARAQFVAWKALPPPL